MVNVKSVEDAETGAAISSGKDERKWFLVLYFVEKPPPGS